MISDKPLEANRHNTWNDQSVRPYPRNAEAQTGASGQEAGKKRSSLNARRHGLTGQVTTMTDEDRTAHDTFSKALIQNLAPDGAIVTFDEKVRAYPRDVLATGSTCGRQLAQRIATDSWRLNRLSAIEDNLLALGLHENGGALCPDHAQIDDALTPARVFTKESKNLQLLSLYEQRLNRAVRKNLALLQSLQATRKASANPT